MKDNFSIQAADYSQFRPHYPPEMIAYIVSFVEEKTMALDVGTGNGQVAVQLSTYFEKVFATDISDKQLENATVKDNIIYKKEPAERTSFADNQFDLITVAQAVHWFDFDLFCKEIHRILRPNGVFAVLGYGLFSTNPETDKILMYFYHDILGKYWDAERKYIDQNYETIPFPFDEIKVDKFQNSFQWTFEQLVGYLETWSATQHFKTKNNSNPIDIIRNDLKESWAKSNHNVTFPLLLRMGTARQ